ncbi:small CPxCG-related zinc finger protein [Halobacterium salinarum]|uniref:Small CPxCG-related zinc finger protein n=1 Tax=Halobacterium salinarum (strain ATCC 33171 / DSM 3754 / JCM 8978 / NBRC 102687 / NCIMB 764 / 91-R6) TaxID=2597657 RepID=A0A4D6GXI1_HALS9|nr:small CPxCG-related zinc finger protein [Halobacterium salinarum]
MFIEITGATTALLALLGVGVVGCCGSKQQQQQQITVSDNSSSKPKRICPDCGMQNPSEANHCGDCGFSFKPDSGESDD